MTDRPPESTRVLGFWSCTALVVGNTMGIGVFLLPAALAPYGLNALWAWLLTIVGCVFLAVVFSGLARAFPRDDGPYGYTARAFGPAVAFFVMWCYWLSIWVTNTTLATGVVGYLSILIPALREVTWLPPYVALALLWFFVLINSLGIRTAAWMQMITTGLKLLPQLGVIVLGLWQLLAHPAVYTAHVPANPISMHEILTASTLVLFAMLGIECAMVPAGKVRDPARTIPRATLVGMLVTGLLYICISMVPMLLLPQTELATSNAPFADLFGRYLGPQYSAWLASFIVVGGLGALNGWTLIAGEMTQTLAAHGDFPTALGKVNAYSAPARAFLLTGALGSLMLVLNYSPSLAEVFTFLITVVTAATLPLYLACSLSVVVLWKRRQLGAVGLREVRWFGAAVLATAYSIWAFAGVGLVPFLWTLVLALAGIPVWLLSRWLQSRTQRRLAAP
jgi:APA family basic amino acid/polyamine antiporter